MSMAYVIVILMLLLLTFLSSLIFKISKNQNLKKIHLEINKGIKFDSEFYNTERKRKVSHSGT